MKKLLIRILSKLGLLESFNLKVGIIVNKRGFKAPLLRGLGLDNIFMSEPWMIQIFEKIIRDKKDKIYVDVGVNLGQTLIKLRSVDESIEYYGFEPNPACIYYVKELSRINKFRKVVLFPVGISNQTSVYELSFFSDTDSDSTATMLSSFRPDLKIYRKEYIACFNFSEIDHKYHIPQIGVIKIDVEGAEKEVIESFSERIITDQPFIQVEILPVYDEKHKDRLARQEALEKFLREINYTIFRIYTDEYQNLSGLEEIQRIGIHSNMNWCEYLLVPSNLKESINTHFRFAKSYNAGSEDVL